MNCPTTRRATIEPIVVTVTASAAAEREPSLSGSWRNDSWWMSTAGLGGEGQGEADEDGPERRRAPGLRPGPGAVLRVELHPRAVLGPDGVGAAGTVGLQAHLRGLGRDDQPQDGQGDDHHQGAEDRRAQAQAALADEPGAERDERGAAQRHAGRRQRDGLGPVVDEPLRHDRADGDGGAHAVGQGHHRVDEVQLPDRLDEADRRRADPGQDGADGHHPLRAAPVDHRPDDERRHAGDDEEEAGRAGDHPGRPVVLVLRAAAGRWTGRSSRRRRSPTSSTRRPRPRTSRRTPAGQEASGRRHPRAHPPATSCEHHKWPSLRCTYRVRRRPSPSEPRITCRYGRGQVVR